MTITVTITGTITMPKQHGLPKSLTGKIADELTFANPAYIEAKKRGGFLGRIPPTMQLWSQEENAIILPRGYGRRLHDLVTEQSCPIHWQDQRITSYVYVPELKDVTLRAYQQRAVSQGMEVTQGVIVSPTGSGKTITALELIRQRGQRALVLVHNSELARQWVEVIDKRLGLRAGTIGSGRWSIGQEITVAMIQTLNSEARRQSVAELAKQIGMVIVDECHHIPATTFAEVIGQFPAKFRYGFSATPKRSDGLEGVIYRILGDVVATVQPEEVLEVGGIVQARVEAIDTGLRFPEVDPQKKAAWSELVAALTSHYQRNRLIAQKTILVSQQKPTLVLTDRVEHAETLVAMIPQALLIHGQMPKSERQRRMKAMVDAQVTVGTKGLLGEGLDCSVWANLILASPMASETPLMQAVGRVIRPAPGKREGVVHDFVDAHPFTLGQWRKRSAIYRKRGFQIIKVA